MKISPQDDRLSQLESLELSIEDEMSPEDYLELLSLYLLAEDFVQFELLWQRTPKTLRSRPDFLHIKDVYNMFGSLSFFSMFSFLKISSCLLKKLFRILQSFMHSYWVVYKLFGYLNNMFIKIAYKVVKGQAKPVF